jgi:hypothetical protein
MKAEQWEKRMLERNDAIRSGDSSEKRKRRA